MYNCPTSEGETQRSDSQREEQSNEEGQARAVHDDAQEPVLYPAPARGGGAGVRRLRLHLTPMLNVTLIRKYHQMQNYTGFRLAVSR